MEDRLKGNKSLIARIQQVEHERDELRKDIEQLCMQQAGPSYLAVATRMHFQRTAALEQEIENLKSKLAACSREKSNLQEELSEAYHIKGQLADLHAAEVSKNMEAEKQLKFFQSCVAAAFAERDHSIMEAEKAREEEEFMVQKLNHLESRVEKLTNDFVEEEKLREALRSDLEEQSKQNEIFKKVINRFYEIRQYSVCGSCEDKSWLDKCEFLLHDSPEKWDFSDEGETSSSKYISSIEDEVQVLRKSVGNLQSKLCVGLEIESHLKKRVHDLENKKTLLEDAIQKGISQLLYFHSQHKEHIRNILAKEYNYLKSIVDALGEKIKQLDDSRVRSWKSPPKDTKNEKIARDLHVNMVAVPDLTEEKDIGAANSLAISRVDTSEALALALQEKVSALLLLSQQEERHVLENNVNLALQKKIEELQRNLLQVTNEKVKALMDFAHLKREYQHLQEEIDDMNQGKVPPDIGGRNHFQEMDGRFKNLLKKTYLKRWIGSSLAEAESQLNKAGNVIRPSYNVDIARMKIENATLKESLDSMEHLTSAVRRLRLSLAKVKESVSTGGTISGPLEAVKDIVCETNLVKTALSSSLPVSWSAESASDIISSFGDYSQADQEKSSTMMISASGGGDFVSSTASSEKMDFVSAAGFEMVEILILAAQMLKDHIICKNVESESLKATQ